MDVNDNDRRLRVQYANALYHMTSRGVGRENVFRDDVDRTKFFELAERTVTKYGWRVYAVSLMSNHFHLCFRTPEPNLSRGAQYLLGNYARQFNRHWRRSGHVFEGRFRCRVIESDRYAWTVSRYVHLNPSPELVDDPLDWPWSSYPGYCEDARRLSWVCYDEHLAAWAAEFGGASYHEFVQEGLAGTRDFPFQQAIDGWILGSEPFAERIRRLISPESHEPDAERARRNCVPLAAIVRAACAEFGILPEQLQQKHSRHPARTIVACLGRQESNATLKEIANVLGLARRDCVSNLAKKAAAASLDSTLARQLLKVRQRLV